MKVFQSIRWRLQLWYGVLLVALLGGFGYTAYRLETSRQLRQTDEELQQRLPILVESQRPVEEVPGLREFELSPENQALFDREEEDPLYYVVWLRHGETPVTYSATAPADVPQPKPGDPPIRQRGNLRESFVVPGPGDCVLVGRSIRGELAASRQFGGWLITIGGAVLIIGLAGGGWLVTRALRPIKAISSAAEKIASGDLSERIQRVDETSELGQLTTVLNATFARLEAAFTRQARFTADAAHELRTPLTVMLTHTQSSLSSADLTEEHRESFDACQRAAQRMRRLTESLLSLARLDSVETSPAPAACNLGPVVHEAVEALRPLAQQQKVSLIAEISASRGEAHLGQIGQVVTNLVSNAIYYNRPGGEVHLRLAEDSAGVTLTVRDTGHGISNDDLLLIFDRFYRADRARSNAAGNVGLGLSISKAIIESHGGTMTVTSTPDVGSTFTVHLPAASEAAQTP
jgi:two-component system, OmpR family, sensor kinase